MDLAYQRMLALLAGKFLLQLGEVQSILSRSLPLLHQLTTELNQTTFDTNADILTITATRSLQYHIQQLTTDIMTSGSRPISSKQPYCIW